MRRRQFVARGIRIGVAGRGEGRGGEQREAWGHRGGSVGEGDDHRRLRAGRLFPFGLWQGTGTLICMREKPTKTTSRREKPPSGRLSAPCARIACVIPLSLAAGQVPPSPSVPHTGSAFQPPPLLPTVLGCPCKNPIGFPASLRPACPLLEATSAPLGCRTFSPVFSSSRSLSCCSDCKGRPQSRQRTGRHKRKGAINHREGEGGGAPSHTLRPAACEGCASPSPPFSQPPPPPPSSLPSPPLPAAAGSRNSDRLSTAVVANP